MKKQYLLIIAVIIINIVNAQIYAPNFDTESTIITKTDTIECFLPSDMDIRTTTLEYKLNKNDKNNERKIVSLDDIVLIKKKDKTYYKVNYNEEPIIMELLTKGLVNLYLQHYYMNAKSSLSGEITSSGYSKYNYYIEKDDTLYKLRRKKERKDLQVILTGNAEVTEMINNLKSTFYNIKIIEIVDKYNNWLKSQN